MEVGAWEVGTIDGLEEVGISVGAWEVGTIDGLEEVGISVGAFDGAVVYIIVTREMAGEIVEQNVRMSTRYARRKQHPLTPPV